jgi:hypothetical protein
LQKSTSSVMPGNCAMSMPNCTPQSQQRFHSLTRPSREETSSECAHGVRVQFAAHHHVHRSPGHDHSEPLDLRDTLYSEESVGLETSARTNREPHV